MINPEVSNLLSKINLQLNDCIVEFNTSIKSIDLSGVVYSWRYDNIKETKSLEAKLQPDHEKYSTEYMAETFTKLSTFIDVFNEKFLEWQTSNNARANLRLINNEFEVLSADILLMRKEPPTAQEIEAELEKFKQE